MVLFMAASVAFLFLSFVLVSIHAWFYTDAAVRAAHVGTLQSLLASDEPATTKSDLAGRVIYVRGTAAASQPITDTSLGVTFERALAVQRVVERYRSGRKTGWIPEETQYIQSPGARLDGWALTETLLAAAPSALETLRPGEDYQPPAGMVLSDSDPYGVFRPSGKAQPSDSVYRPAADDRRIVYRVLRDGPLSVIAAVDKSDRGLVPLRIDREDLALVAKGSVDAAAMIEDALEDTNAARVEATLWALAAGWAVFMIPAFWAPMRRWIGLTLVPLAGVMATLGAAMAAAVPGGLGGSFFAGQAVATGYVLLVGLLAWRRGTLR